MGRGLRPAWALAVLACWAAWAASPPSGRAQDGSEHPAAEGQAPVRRPRPCRSPPKPSKEYLPHPDIPGALCPKPDEGGLCLSPHFPSQEYIPVPGTTGVCPKLAIKGTPPVQGTPPRKGGSVPAEFGTPFFGLGPPETPPSGPPPKPGGPGGQGKGPSAPPPTQQELLKMMEQVQKDAQKKGPGASGPPAKIDMGPDKASGATGVEPGTFRKLDPSSKESFIERMKRGRGKPQAQPETKKEAKPRPPADPPKEDQEEANEEGEEKGEDPPEIVPALLR